MTHFRAAVDSQQSAVEPKDRWVGVWPAAPNEKKGAFEFPILGRFAIGAVADRIGRPLTLVGVQASLGLSMLLWSSAAHYPALAFFAVWMGLSYSGIVSLMPAPSMDLFGARAVSSIIGALYTGAALGNAAGPWVAGRVFDATGSYAVVILGCAVLSTGATFAAWRSVQRAR